MHTRIFNGLAIFFTILLCLSIIMYFRNDFFPRSILFMQSLLILITVVRKKLVWFISIPLLLFTIWYMIFGSLNDSEPLNMTSFLTSLTVTKVPFLSGSNLATLELIMIVILLLLFFLKRSRKMYGFQ